MEGGGGGVTGARAKGDFYPWRLIIGYSYCLQVDATNTDWVEGRGVGSLSAAVYGIAA